MKKVFNFGKIDFERKGSCCNTVKVEVEYNEKNGKKVFTAYGSIWNARHTDILAGGQCLDTIAEFIKNAKFLKIYRLWQLYHLNDMHPECEHQEALGWKEQAKEEIKLYHYKLKREFLNKKDEATTAAIKALKSGESFTPTEEQIKMANLSIFLDSYEPILSPYYKLYKSCIGTPEVEVKTRGWVTYGEGENQSLNGILGKPCPVCGYKYGYSWTYRAIAEQDEQIIYALLMDRYDKKVEVIK